MSCEVCGNKDGPCGDRKSTKSSFRIHLRTGFEDHMVHLIKKIIRFWVSYFLYNISFVAFVFYDFCVQNVPCFARDKFHDATANKRVLLVENDDNEFYGFQLHRKSYKTRIFGEEYKEFLEHYNMKKGDNVKIHLGNPCNLGYFYMEAFDRDGHAKERVEGYFLS